MPHAGVLSPGCCCPGLPSVLQAASSNALEPSSKPSSNQAHRSRARRPDFTVPATLRDTVIVKLATLFHARDIPTAVNPAQAQGALSRCSRNAAAARRRRRSRGAARDTKHGPSGPATAGRSAGRTATACGRPAAVGPKTSRHPAARAATASSRSATTTGRPPTSGHPAAASTAAATTSPETSGNKTTTTSRPVPSHGRGRPRRAHEPGAATHDEARGGT